MIQLSTLFTTEAKLTCPPFWFPAKMLLFVDQPEEIGRPKPWDILLCKQTSEQVKRHFTGQATKIIPYSTLLTDLTQPKDSIWMDIERTRRQKINQTEKLPFSIRINPYGMKDLYHRIATFHRNKALPVPLWPYFKSLTERCDVFTIALDGHDAIVHIVVKDFPRRAMVMYSCVLAGEEINNSVRGSLNSYLHWWEVQHYQDMGYQHYDWGGVVLDKDSPAYGITRFKREFGGVISDEWHFVLLGSWFRPFGALTKWKESRI